MANEEHLKTIYEGPQAWNRWKDENRWIRADLSGADLSGLNLSGANLIEADISEANLCHTDLRGADLSGADLSKGDLRETDFRGADLSRADLTKADLECTDFRRANLTGTTFRQTDLSTPDLDEENAPAAYFAGADLCGADLGWADLSGADLRFAKLTDANLYRADLGGANLSRVDLCRAKLGLADLRGADLSWADLTAADLHWADLSRADLRGANLSRADFSDAHFREANLCEADLSQATIRGTSFGDNDLSSVKGLETVIHDGPSTIGIDTLFRSAGKIPQEFLRGAGVPEDLITFLPSFVGQAIEFYSCFISYSHHDEEFSKRLHSRMRSENLRVWFSPEHMKGGKKLHEEIFRAIQIHDKLLLVLSENSMKSKWVETEIRRATKVEREENRRKLFPIRLVDFETIQKWECFDADSGKDLAIELREYYIPDFSHWKDHGAFEDEFRKLLRDLKASEK